MDEKNAARKLNFIFDELAEQREILTEGLAPLADLDTRLAEHVKTYVDALATKAEAMEAKYPELMLALKELKPNDIIAEELRAEMKELFEAIRNQKPIEVKTIERLEGISGEMKMTNLDELATILASKMTPEVKAELNIPEDKPLPIEGKVLIRTLKGESLPVTLFDGKGKEINLVELLQNVASAAASGGSASVGGVGIPDDLITDDRKLKVQAEVTLGDIAVTTEPPYKLDPDDTAEDGKFARLNLNNEQIVEVSNLSTLTALVDQLEGYTDGLEAALSAIGSNTDGIEGLLTALGANTDNLETQSANIATLLTTIRDNADTVESLLTAVRDNADTLEPLITALNGFVDGLEGSFTSLLAKDFATSAKQDLELTELKTLNALVPHRYDEIDLSYTGTDLSTVTYKLAGAIVSTLTLTYTSGNLTKVMVS